jgi:hypothetical protein
VLAPYPCAPGLFKAVPGVPVIANSAAGIEARTVMRANGSGMA